ncbi:MAG: PD40 domain-containing protein [Caldilineaceae bacterium]|nr:PD40 domain-containing protein [Caldilineaceae bacterium]MBP8108787.1 PD40 domain-containing protein [Caldilineaceae bacterium]MBP8122086.1 PD40 domain-containing protein [Caldilineaceae bacterium]MBP9072541.1 PD40 domain-containing protein [Caldilineaceae bacterium]
MADLEPAQSTDSYPWVRAAFQSYRDGNWEIYVCEDDGQNQRRLTYQGAADIRPALRPGADQVAFVSNRDGSFSTTNWEIYRANWDGSGVARLTNNPALDTMPVWSPDGSKIAFVSDRDGNAEIYTMNADGSNVTRLTWRAEDDVMPAWSRDNRIAWVVASAVNSTLWVMNGDGGGQHPVFGPQPYLEYPSWKRNSSRIAVSFGSFDKIDGNILWMNPDGTGVVVLQSLYPDTNVDVTMPQWGPNNGWYGPSGAAWMWYSTIKYVEYGGKWYMDWSYISKGLNDPLFWLGASILDNITGVGNSSYDMMPSVELTDVMPPQSTVKALPEYSQGTANIQIISSDAGGSGILEQELQFKIGRDGAWTDNVPGVDLTQWYSDPGNTVYFRSRATDLAINTEPWPADPNGDTHTTFYTSNLSGRVLDNRGVPFANSGLTFSSSSIHPIQTDADGRFDVYMHYRLPTDLTVPQSGFADNTVHDLTGTRTPSDVYLSPTPSAIQNGEFENGLAVNWLASAGVSTTPDAYAGKSAANLRSSATAAVTLSQVVTVAADWHQPTLAFIYASNRLTTTHPSVPFQVSVTAGLTTTQVFSATTQPTGHQLGWADLSPWAGQIITVTFALAQTDYDEETDLFLDHITLAPWLTPVAESVTPAAFDPGVSTPITVTGQNFLDGVTVRLIRGEQIVSRVTLTRLDAHTLTVDLPALGPGIYDLWVTNPGGQQSVKMGAIRVGKQSYLPSVAR